MKKLRDCLNAPWKKQIFVPFRYKNAVDWKGPHFYGFSRISGFASDAHAGAPGQLVKGECMLLLSRHYALAAEEQRAEQLAALESDLLTPLERKQGIKLVPSRHKRVIKQKAQAEIKPAD